jgi:hypothetical protein
VGIDEDIATASVRAVLSAANSRTIQHGVHQARRVAINLVAGIAQPGEADERARGENQFRAFRQAQQIEAAHENILAQLARRDGKSLARQLIEQFGMEQMNLSQIGRCRIFRHAAAMFHRRSAMRISANALPCDQRYEQQD